VSWEEYAILLSSIRMAVGGFAVGNVVLHNKWFRRFCFWAVSVTI
jgi:hypothetical protein